MLSLSWLRVLRAASCRPLVGAALAIWAGVPFLITQSPAGAQAPAYLNPRLPLEARVADLLPRLTLEEKLGLLGGTGFATRPIPRLQIPAMGMADGPMGVRGGTDGTQGPSTAFLCGVAMAATWDPVLVQRLGRAIGEEVQNKGEGADVILGPCVNIHRTPLSGRNWESFSEDPALAASMAAAYVSGVQSSGAAACVKHYACNNQEYERDFIDVRVGERALHEIYLPAFKAAVQSGHAWSLMDAYNCINGPHASANDLLLNQILKRDWGFDGLVMSDWGAVHDTLGATQGGNDLEMPTGDHLNPAALKPLIMSGQVREAVIDDKVRRILRLLVRTGLLDGAKRRDPSLVNSKAHQTLVREAGGKAIVLLKNETVQQKPLLPLDRNTIHSLALIGPNAAELRWCGGGSGYVQPPYTVSPVEGIRDAAGPQVRMRYAQGAELNAETLNVVPASALLPPEGVTGAHGLQGEYFANDALKGQPALLRRDAVLNFDWASGSPAPSLPAQHFSVRWTGRLVAPMTGIYQLGITSDDGSRVFLDGKQILDNWGDHAAQTRTTRISLSARSTHAITVEYYQGTGQASVRLGWIVPDAPGAVDPLIGAAVAAAKEAEVAIVFAGLSSNFESEGSDRTTMALPGNQDALIRAVAAANPRTIVVLFNGGPILMNGWIDKVPALLEAWYVGQEGGHSIADVLFGSVNPSGHLPDTLAVRREDYPDFKNYPGQNGHVDYAEGIYVGYRHFDRAQIAPRFPFGYGLSYTRFTYSDLQLSSSRLSPRSTLSATLTVKNTGSRAGEEVVQLYLHDLQPKIDRPVRELKRFTRVALRPGQSRKVTFTLDPRTLAYYDVPGRQWRADAGRYEVQIGASSRDLRLRHIVTLSSVWTAADGQKMEQFSGR